jgi:hypothetical protein
MPAIAALVQELAHFPGVQGCALVEAESGMVWHHAGNLPDIEHIGEAAVEFWRVHQRVSAQLSSLGGLKSAAYSFADHVVALFPCGEQPARVLICVADKTGVAWNEWAPQVMALRRLLATRVELSSTVTT